jgi:hypothetical protein
VTAGGNSLTLRALGIVVRRANGDSMMLGDGGRCFFRGASGGGQSHPLCRFSAIGVAQSAYMGNDVDVDVDVDVDMMFYHTADLCGLCQLRFQTKFP